ncbi:hypothetical protein RND71_018062 [Anisodus tanguticus]|uniref:Uncharacterized protein n=1 Tax=Anisodus tanguticus TaxID=243964 RepID=A0AAE1S3I4_9SOLA|nr:hypothetical protein RND71_018062 [Anisodus tanguticus]
MVIQKKNENLTQNFPTIILNWERQRKLIREVFGRKKVAPSNGEHVSCRSEPDQQPRPQVHRAESKAAPPPPPPPSASPMSSAIPASFFLPSQYSFSIPSPIPHFFSLTPHSPARRRYHDDADLFHRKAQQWSKTC